MHKTFFHSHRWLVCATITLAFLTPNLFAQSEYDPGWAKNFRVGLMAGFNIKANLRMSGHFAVSGSQGSSAAGVNHTYTDGYVFLDNTGDAGRMTWNWGYNNASQVDTTSDPNHLLMHSANGFDVTESATAKDEPYMGFDMAYGGVLWHRNEFRIGWELGFGLLPIKISDNTTVSGVHVRTRSEEHTSEL